MDLKCKNIYRIAREDANMSRNVAAELLGISMSSLVDYELDKTIPNDGTVCDMMEVYRASWLGYQHLKLNTLIGQICLPDIEFTGLAQSVLRLQKEMADVERVKPDMVEVAYDNVVHPYQESTWSVAEKEVQEMVGAGLGVLFYQKEKEPTLKGPM